MHQSLLFQDMLWKIKADIFCYHNLGELVRKMPLVKWEQFFFIVSEDQIKTEVKSST